MSDQTGSKTGSEIKNQCNAISECINRKINNKKKEQAVSEIHEIQRFDVCGKVMDVIAQDAIEKLKGSKEIIINIIENRKNDKVIGDLDKSVNDLQKWLKAAEEREIDPIQLRRIDYLSDYITYIKSQNVMVRRAIAKDWATRGTRKKKGREGGFNFDPDASLISCYVFCKTMSTLKGRQWKIRHISPYEYKLCEVVDRKEEGSCDGNEICFRGDVMNSWLTTLNEYLDLGKNKEYFENLPKVREKGHKRIKFLCDPKNYNSELLTLPSWVTEFLEVVYTIGNFALVPREPIYFNKNRSQPTKDYWDLTLLAIYEYYMGEKESKWSIRSSLGEKGIEKWLKQSDNENGQQGWNKFVKGNYMQPFVEKIGENEYGKPYELWDGHFKQLSDKKKTDWLLPQYEWQFEQFFVNARIRIIERGRLIAKKLVDNE